MYTHLIAGIADSFVSVRIDFEAIKSTVDIYALNGQKYLDKLKLVPQVARDKDTYTTQTYFHNIT